MFELIVIEPVTPSRAGTFKTIRLRALQDAPMAFGSTYAKESQLTDGDWLERVSRWNGQLSTGLFAIDNGVVCGIAAGLLDEKDATQAHLLSMWVAPSHRRLGIGRLLVSAIDDWARSRGAGTLRLMVTSSNHEALAFYKSLGFVNTGKVEPYPNDRALVEHEMSRSV